MASGARNLISTQVSRARELGRDFFETTTAAARDACAGDGGRGYKGVGAVAVAASGVTADGASTIKRPPDYASEFVFWATATMPNCPCLV